MDNDEKVRILQLAYAGALADAVLRMGRDGILPRVTEEKKREQMRTGKAKAAQFGISRPEEVFQKVSEIFDCARWEVTQMPSGFSAETRSCKLCAIAKNMGAPGPCDMYCLDPMEGMVKGLAPEMTFAVNETLWDGSKCRVEVAK
jgi:L-2-amino-thiazoline-4-carboxylic acid hydrolase